VNGRVIHDVRLKKSNGRNFEKNKTKKKKAASVSATFILTRLPFRIRPQRLKTGGHIAQRALEPLIIDTGQITQAAADVGEIVSQLHRTLRQNLAA
jgi:hypothetical protein